MTGFYKEPCPHCGQNISPRKVTMNRVLVSAAIKAFLHCMRTNSWNSVESAIKIRDLKLTAIEYARFNDLVRFGLAFKNPTMKSGEYGIPRKRIYQFVDNTWQVAAYYWHNPVTKQNTMSEERIFCAQVPSTQELIAQYGPTLTEYKNILEAEPDNQ